MNSKPDPAEVKEVWLDESKNDPNVPTQEETEDIIVKKFVKTASSQFWSENVGVNLVINIVSDTN